MAITTLIKGFETLTEAQLANKVSSGTIIVGKFYLTTDGLTQAQIKDAITRVIL